MNKPENGTRLRVKVIASTNSLDTRLLSIQRGMQGSDPLYMKINDTNIPETNLGHFCKNLYPQKLQTIIVDLINNKVFQKFSFMEYSDEDNLSNLQHSSWC